MAQLVRWSEILGSSPQSVWVTFESPQSGSLLSGRNTIYVPYIAPRDLLGTMKAFRLIMKRINWREEEFHAAVTTGAALGLAGIVAARLHGIPSVYIESVSRVHGPSLTGRLISLDKGVDTYCQYESWSSAGWRYGGSLFDGFRVISKSQVDTPTLFVTLGTIKPFRFDALVDSVLATGLADERTVWQLGATDRHNLPGRVYSQMSAEQFMKSAAEADVVITHAGVGTLMHLLEMGICPLVVPRRRARNEHVDDHQLQIAELLAAKELVQLVDADDLTAVRVIGATRRAVIKA